MLCSDAVFVRAWRCVDACMLACECVWALWRGEGLEEWWIVLCVDVLVRVSVLFSVSLCWGVVEGAWAGRGMRV